MNEEDEMNDFKKRVQTLQNVVSDITIEIDSQNKKLETDNSSFAKQFSQIRNIIGRIDNLGKYRFNSTFYMILATFVFGFLFFILYIVI